MANACVGLFLLVFWTSLWLFVKVDHLVHGRPLSDGPSFIPVVPIVPLVAYGCGWVLNELLPWLGVAIVAATHVGYLFWAWFSARRTGDIG